MTISTMERLEALDVGSPITVNGARWTITDGSMATNGSVSVPLTSLEGQVIGGQVSAGTMFTPGTLYCSGGTYYYVGSAEADPRTQAETVIYVSLNRDGIYLSSGTFCPSRPTDLGEAAPFPSEWSRRVIVMCHDMARALTEEWRSARHECSGGDSTDRYEALSEERDRLRVDLNELRNLRVGLDELRNALSDYARSGVDLDSDLADILDEHDIDHSVTETVTVDVAVAGETSIDLETVYSNAYIEELISPSRAADWESSSESVLNLTWAADYSFQVEIDEGDCACGEVTRQQIVDRLEQDSIRYDSFEYQCNCPNC